MDTKADAKLVRRLDGNDDAIFAVAMVVYLLAKNKSKRNGDKRK